MLTTDQLRSLIGNHESDRVELTTSTNNTDKFCEAICAFANDFPNHRQPGYLIVGVDDNGNPSGQSVTDALLRRLADLRSNVNLEPLPAMTVQKFSLGQADVAIVEVSPSDLPPVRYKGRTWIRVGPSRRGANQQEERILIERRRSLQRPYDLESCRDCSFDDLVPGLFLASYLPVAVDAEIIAENQRDMREQMASLRFYDLDADHPTNAAVLLFGKDPLRWIPGAWVQFVRWAGVTMSADVAEEKRFSGDLVSVLRDLDSFVGTRVRTRPLPDTTLRERPDVDYPAVAIRELLLNAIMHRSYESNAPVHFYWYEDRIEIQNPGGLYGMATPENFPNRTDYRNPVVSEAMATLGYVNRFGRGVIRAREALHENGNPAPEFKVDDSTGVAVTIWGKT